MDNPTPRTSQSSRDVANTKTHDFERGVIRLDLNFYYRDYNGEELIELLTQNDTYFSRRNSYSQDQLFPSSTITVYKTANRSCAAFEAALVVEAKCCNNCENLVAQIQQNGYELIRGSWVKKWQIASLMTYRPLNLLKQVFHCLETAHESMPFQLYESNQYRLIFEYYRFLESPLRKISYRQLMEYLGYWSDKDKGRIEIMAENSPYMTARYKEGNWAAWINGDTIIPLFPDEKQAITYLGLAE